MLGKERALGTVRRCSKEDFEAIYSVINDGAWSFRDVIPGDRWKDPYMSRDELRRELADGVVFWDYEAEGSMVGVMGLQDKGDVILIRHAYVRMDWQRHGIGSALLAHIKASVDRPCLVGTWASADWAIDFYEKHGFRLVPRNQKKALLERYWSIPDRQIETSVVLADEKYHG